MFVNKNSKLKEDTTKEDFRLLVLVFMILYFISPIDVCPGPIDDLIVIVAGMMIRAKEGEKRG